jgi:hypothetical protein
METIGFLYFKGHIKLEEASETLGNSILQFRKYFNRYIKYRQKKDNRFYAKYLCLCQDLEKHRQKKLDC